MGKPQIRRAHFANVFEGDPHLRIRTIAPYPTPRYTFTNALTKTNANIQYLGPTYKIHQFVSLNELLNHHPNCKHHVKPTICPIGLGQDMQYMMPLVANDAMVKCNNRDMTYHQITQCLQADR